jgi:hypothetical protein
MAMSTIGDGPVSLIRLGQWARDHEIRDNERFASIDDKLTWLVRLMVGVILSIAAWLAVQLWTGNQERLARLEAVQTPAAAMATR